MFSVFEIVRYSVLICCTFIGMDGNNERPQDRKQILKREKIPGLITPE